MGFFHFQKFGSFWNFFGSKRAGLSGNAENACIFVYILLLEIFLKKWSKE